MSKSEWIYPKDLQAGVEGLPCIDLQLQTSLRQARRLTFSKLGNRVVYKKKWIEEYLESNIREAKPKDRT